MATHSSVLALRIPGTGEPGGLLSLGSHRVGHDWSDLAACLPIPVKAILLIPFPATRTRAILIITFDLPLFCAWYVYVCMYMCIYIYKVVSGTFETPWTIYSAWNSPGQKTGMGSLSLLQEIFPTQGSNLDLLHCRQILYQLSYQGSPFGYGSVQHSPLSTMTCAWGYKSVWKHYTYKQFKNLSI